MVAALHIDADEIYVTIYRKHEGLIRLLKRYGFLVYGTKGHEDEPEFVFVKSMKYIQEICCMIILIFILQKYESLFYQ